MKEVQIVYDFDGTLTPSPVPFFPILKECGITEKEFYQKIAELKDNGINDVYESWFQSFFEIVQNSSLETHDVTKGAQDIIFCEGIEEWFSNVKEIEGKKEIKRVHIRKRCGKICLPQNYHKRNRIWTNKIIT